MSPVETSAALNCICRTVQQRVLSQISSANQERNCKLQVIFYSSNILSLSPFLDESGLMRISRRLKNSNLAFNACYLILLPRKHILTQHIIEREHTQNLHMALQATMAFVHQRFWLLSLRSTVCVIIQKCIIYFRADLVNRKF